MTRREKVLKKFAEYEKETDERVRLGIEQNRKGFIKINVRDKDGNAVSLYHLDSKCLKKTLEAPPMAEEMAYVDGRIYVLNDSACKQYIFGKFLSGNNLYSYEYKLSD